MVASVCFAIVSGSLFPGKQNVQVSPPVNFHSVIVVVQQPKLTLTSYYYIAMAFYFATAFEDLACSTDDDEFMDTIRSIAFTFLLLGIIVFIAMTARSTLMETAAGHMTRNMQNAWFEAVLRQDMAYFDVKDVAGQAIILSSNGAKYRSECLLL
jgi:ABC-type multidrug transport system fused ATPase/permease subunit